MKDISFTCLSTSWWSLHDSRFSVLISEADGGEHVTADINDEDEDRSECEWNAKDNEQ